MRKKLLSLLVGLLALCSVVFSQVNVNETINGNNIVGQVTNVNPSTTLALGTMIAFISEGTQYTYHVTNTPSSNPAGLLSDIANAINNAFNANSVSGSGGPVTPNRFGSNAGEYSVSWIHGDPVEIPFDFGITAVLGAGALAAIRTARIRKKEQITSLG